MKNKQRNLTLSVLLILVSLMVIFGKAQINKNDGHTYASDAPTIISASIDDGDTYASDAPTIISASIDDGDTYASDAPTIISA